MKASMKQTSLLLILIFSLSITYAQKVLVEGKVTDENNFPLSFANIRVQGTTLGASANKNGKYELKLKSGKYILIATYIGYISDTLEVEAEGNVK